MVGFFEDLRYGVRGLVRNRGFAAVAVASLALGIGANTTIFTLINAVLLRPLPVRDPSGLAAVQTVDPRIPGYLPCSYPNYKDYRDRNTVFSSLVIYSAVILALTDSGDPRMLWGQMVSGNYFTALGVNPVVGRGFLPEEDANPGAHAVAVVSYGFWDRELGRDPQVTGRSINLNGRPFRVIGVAPPGFQGLSKLAAADVWVPMMMYEQVLHTPAWFNMRRASIFSVLGRLKRGVSLQQAETQMQILAQELEREYPKDNQGRRVRLASPAETAIAARTKDGMSKAGTVALIISGLVLLIACANVANLLLARAAGRSREIRVRVALGASRWRLVRQLLTESVMLAIIGGALGLLLARWARDLLWSMRPPLFAHAFVRLDLDGRVLGYALAVSVLTGIFFGLVPALGATRSDLATNLQDRARQPASARGRWNPRSLLVMGQVAFSLIALVGAALFVRSLRNANRIDLGFDAEHLGLVAFNLAQQHYSEARALDFYQRALERAAAVPGVSAASLSRDVPFQVAQTRTVLLQGQESTASGQGRITLSSAVWPGYFEAVRIPILRGRGFSLLDTKTAARVAVVNEAAAAYFWPGENAVGKVVQLVGENVPVEIVGVARNANYQTIGEKPQAMLYLSIMQYHFPFATLYIRSAGNVNAAVAVVRRQVQAMDRNLVLQSETLAATIRESLWAQRLLAGLLAVFGSLALLLATIGIYGVVAYSVHQRVREIGVRMALGATPVKVQRMLLGEGLYWVGVGAVAGIGIALAASSAVKGLLSATSPRDVGTFVLVPALLGLVAMLACWIPARRSTRIDPSAALRDE